MQITPGLLDGVRVARGFTSDTALAAALGVSHMTLSRVRRGAEPSGVLIASLALATGLSMDKIVRVVPRRRACGTAA
ncbi:hypothetical protein NN4_64490 [Nocardia ninae NBRC 108245]|uniref:HTH cro/C1-type domain-containing protein n=1 Tax=Nocardia ninae NBRC 108245 TaxID=1210091 RepID=A0A511MMS5_9NOCA|nr:hypothetical protein NN4_64490 [Nocardia ninae NBRC 108245]